ncbi:hypothetical protein E3W66_07770 [Gammaproteobacteria bacterium LSUCC0057]|uniref:PPIase cyclophilin-type domain-containing protein n=1 Tax=Gammaproteobacteria bacterium LSUCC0057 TaxID=2559237 RepID=A0A4Y8UJ80_9GAMM|nr:hypothetical protein E3W66_07770 [Gammaproteobacteria bacterium LSUCC0057]
MTRFLSTLRYLCFALLCNGMSHPSIAETGNITVALTTTQGLIELTLDREKAPLAVNYWLSYANSERYLQANFYRSASMDEDPNPQMIQGGLLAAGLNQTPTPSVQDFAVDPLMNFETTAQSGLKHQRGSVSLARDLLGGGGVIPELCIYLRDSPMLDAGGSRSYDQRGFPVIGTVTAGLDVVEKISQQPRQGQTAIAFLQGQILTQPVRLLSVTVTE